MEQLSQVDLSYLVKELQFLNNSRIDNFYYYNNKYILKLYVKTKGNYYLTIKPGRYTYLNNEKDFTSEKNNFVDYLRKYLKDAILKNIEQITNERILILNIEKLNEKKELHIYKLIIELFKPGNIILTDKNFKILNSIIKKEFKDRAIKKNINYELPPKKEITLKKLIEELKKNSTDNNNTNLKNEKIVKILAKEFNLGGKYSNEILAITKIPQNKKLIDISEKEINLIETELQKIIKKEIEPYLIYKNKEQEHLEKEGKEKEKLNEPYSFIPFKFISVEKSLLKKTSSFNEAIKIYYKTIDKDVNKQEEELQKEINKLKKRLEILEKQKEEILKQYQSYTEIGNKIFENYNIIEQLIKLGKLIEKNEEIKDKELKDLKKYIKEINKKDKYIVIKKE